MQDLQQLYNSFPDHEPLLDFDPFLVGDGSAELMKKSDKYSNNTSNQLSGINNFRDLIKDPEESLSMIEDDLANFSQAVEPYQGDFSEVFFNTKKAIFKKFNFLKKKSQSMGRLVRERELVLSDSDQYLIEYLGKDRSVGHLERIASLIAYRDMRFTEVKFINKSCQCSLCRSHDGMVYDLANLISEMSNTEFLHDGVCGDFIPVVNERDEDLVQNVLAAYGTTYEDVPVELADYLKSGFKKYCTNKVVRFTDFSMVKDWSGECLVENPDEILVHYGYVGYLGPFDYLDQWFAQEENEQGSDEVFYYNGCQVTMKNGQYINIDTGEYVEVIL